MDLNAIKRELNIANARLESLAKEKSRAQDPFTQRRVQEKLDNAVQDVCYWERMEECFGFEPEPAA